MSELKVDYKEFESISHEIDRVCRVSLIVKGLKALTNL